MLNRRQFTQWLIGASAVFPITALAHAQHVILTEMNWNNSNKAIEIIHKFQLYHTEQALFDRGVITTADLGSLENKARFALYTEEKFKLLSAEKNTYALETLGLEIQGEFCFIYQECSLNTFPDTFWVQSKLLNNTPFNFKHLVNFTHNGRVSSIKFDGQTHTILMVAKAQ